MAQTIISTSGMTGINIGSGGSSIGTIDGTITNSHQDYTIKGQMVVASMNVSQMEMVNVSPEELKKRLVYLLAEEMLKNNCIEFTRQSDDIRLETMIRAYAYVVPDDKVRILRTRK